jgi:hypothetical protein
MLETILISAPITKLTRPSGLDFQARVPEFPISLRCSCSLLPEAIPVSKRSMDQFQSYFCPAENRKLAMAKGTRSLKPTTSALSVGINGKMLTTSTLPVASFYEV